MRPCGGIVLYRGNHWTVGQGLGFYADRRLSQQFLTAEALAGFLRQNGPGACGIAGAADFEELRGRLGDALVERARPGEYVIFGARDPLLEVASPPVP